MKKGDKLLLFASVLYKGTALTTIVESFQATGVNIDYLVAYELENHLTDNQLDEEQFDGLNKKALANLNKIANKYTHILCVDFHTPGLERIIKKYAQIKWGALMHGGSFFDNDIYSPCGLVKMEKVLFGAYSVIYLPTKFAQQQIPEKYHHKTKTFNWGLDYISKYKKHINKTKKYSVIFPHRPSSDKGFDDFLHIAKQLPLIDFHFLTASDVLPSKLNDDNYKNIAIHRKISRMNYFKILGKSKIILSCSKQETFGFSVMDAVMMGAFPVLPNRQAYPELFSCGIKLYGSLSEAIGMVGNSVNLQQSYPKPSAPTFRTLIKDFMS